MDARKLRLAVAAVIFVAWIGYLFYLAMGARHTVVLSRPQFLVSPLWIQGAVTKEPGQPVAKVEVRKVFRPNDKTSLEGTTITVAGLPDIEAIGWSGPGEYILPLTETREGKMTSYRVTPLPPSPGFVSDYCTVQIRSEGKEKSKVRQLVVQLAGLEPKDVEKLLARLPADIKRNVPIHQAEQIKQQLQALDAIVSLPRGESRIYPATAETLSQLEALSGW